MYSRFAVVAVASVVFACGATAAETLTPAMDQWNVGRSQMKIVPGAEPGVCSLKGATSLFSKNSIPVDPAKKYRVSGEFRNASGTPNLQISFGVDCRDKSGKSIAGANVDVIPDTDTMLATAAKKGDSVLVVKDASNWKSGRTVVFNTAPDFADLPNRTTDHSAIKSIAANADNRYDVTLSTPLARNYPADTKVRQHGMGEWFHFPVRTTPLNGEWSTFTFDLAGVSPSGSDSKRWRNGTVQAGIACYLNPGQKADGVIEWRNLKIEVIE